MTTLLPVCCLPSPSSVAMAVPSLLVSHQLLPGISNKLSRALSQALTVQLNFTFVFKRSYPRLLMGAADSSWYRSSVALKSLVIVIAG